MKFIDPHIHLFNLALGQYQWLKPENPPFWPDKNIINNNFTESDLSTSDKWPISEKLSITGELKRLGLYILKRVLITTSLGKKYNG